MIVMNNASNLKVKTAALSWNGTSSFLKTTPITIILQRKEDKTDKKKHKT